MICKLVTVETTVLHNIHTCNSDDEEKISFLCCAYLENMCIRHRCKGEKDSSQHHKSPHQARAYRRGLDVVTGAEIRPSCRTNDAVCIFSYEYLSETAKSNCAVKRLGESARWANLTIVKINSMSARRVSSLRYIIISTYY